MKIRFLMGRSSKMEVDVTEACEIGESISDRKREEFRDCLIECIEEVLSFSKVVLNFLEMNTEFKKETILECPDVFSSELEDLFGQSARGIEDLILERLYMKINKKYEKDRDRKFEDYIGEALKGFLEYY